LVESHYKKNNRKNTKKLATYRQFSWRRVAPIWRESTETPLLLVRYGYCYYEGFLLIQLNTYLFVFCIITITQFFVKHILGRQVCVHKKILLDTTLDLFWKIPNGKKKYYTGTTHSLVKKIWNNNGQKEKKNFNHRTTILAYFILIKALSLPLKKALRFFPLPSSKSK